MSQPKPKPVTNKGKPRETQTAASAGTHVVNHRRARPLRESDMVRLTDAHIQPALREVIAKATATPESARAYPVRLGTLTKAGNVTRRYGGK
jgi:hypothetical protein